MTALTESSKSLVTSCLETQKPLITRDIRQRRMEILPRKPQFPGSNVMFRIVLAETAHLDVSRLFRVRDVELCCLVERVGDVIYHFRARITRPSELFCVFVPVNPRARR